MIEALLVVLVVALLAAAVLLTATLAGVVLRVLAAYFLVPMHPPPSLTRLVAMVEGQVAEQRAAAIAGLDAGPRAPDALVVLRSVTAPLGSPPSLPRIAAMLEWQADAAGTRCSAPPAPELVLALRAVTGGGRRRRRGLAGRAAPNTPTRVRYAGLRAVAGGGVTRGSHATVAGKHRRERYCGYL